MDSAHRHRSSGAIITASSSSVFLTLMMHPPTPNKPRTATNIPPIWPRVSITILHVLLVALAALLLYCSRIYAPELLGLYSLRGISGTGPVPLLPSLNSTTCPQWGGLYPTGEHAQVDHDLDVEYATSEFQMKAFMLLGLAIRVPTETYDDNGPVGQDPRWVVFKQLHDLLEEQFPLVYTHLSVTKVNTYGLVFQWQGSTNAKPYILAAHQDVVPVDPSTIDQWKHAPFSGLYDGTWIWGRGSRDDKCNLISQLIVVETLLRKGFRPSRTLLLAYGFDEEATGTEGAKNIAAHLERTYGRDNFAFILDEGGRHSKDGDLIFANPAVSERGYLDVKVEVFAPGGHSSIPPEHTSIGLLSRLVTTIEDNPHDPRLVRSGTQFSAIQCKAAYSPSFPNDLRRLAAKSLSDDSALKRLEKGLVHWDPVYKAILGTTQAVDLIEGGIKVNALPERAAVVINHRIAEHSSVHELQKHLTAVVSSAVEKYDLALEAFGKEITSGKSGRVILTDAYGTFLEPSPITPIEQGPWSVLAGSIKATFENSPLYNTFNVVVAPSLVMGNTDTRYYWNLTRHIFRMNPFFDDDAYNQAHTINEAFRADALIESVRFYTKLILNADQSDVL